MWHKKRKSYHAIFIINKTSKLNFIKVFETLDIDVAKNSLPNEKSRARRKHGPKPLREPGKLQKILRSEIHRSLERSVVCDIGASTFLKR